VSGDPLFTVDLEDWNHGLHVPKNGHSSIMSFYYLLSLLRLYNIKVTLYVLGKFLDEYPSLSTWFANHIIKSHGYNHFKNEQADRKPYSWLGFSGGFYFRLFPYWLIKLMVKIHGHFYIHIHDLDEDHPKLSNPIMNFKRHVGLKTARTKLKRLMQEIKWADP